jgi:hypothetical protein
MPRNKYIPAIKKKNPTASFNLGSLKNPKLNLDLEDALLFFSFSGFLNVLDLYVFCAI